MLVDKDGDILYILPLQKDTPRHLFMAEKGSLLHHLFFNVKKRPRKMYFPCAEVGNARGIRLMK